MTTQPVFNAVNQWNVVISSSDYHIIAQMNAILHDETAVEQIKKQGPYENQRTTRELLADVFGKGEWLIQSIHDNSIDTSH